MGSRLTLLREAAVDHLRGDARAQVEVFQHVLHGLGSSDRGVGGVAQHLLSEESHNNSKKTLISGTNVAPGYKRFLIPVI